ncbi:hypothetical protein HQQ80_05900 [Microbacteriaceae bacterium VKM Ac-2855]|nr:hypothetical protein [Microbacteriaceae bacterium VKM Ac-2855]
MLLLEELKRDGIGVVSLKEPFLFALRTHPINAHLLTLPFGNRWGARS